MLGVVGSDGQRMPPHFFEKRSDRGGINQEVYLNVFEEVVLPWIKATYEEKNIAYVFQQVHFSLLFNLMLSTDKNATQLFRMGPPHIQDRLHKNGLRIMLPTSGPRTCGPHQARVSQNSCLMHTGKILLHTNYCRFEPPRLRILVICARPGLPCVPF